MCISGGCQCGAVRYRFVGEIGDASICHCRMCQKAFGSWGAALVSLSAEAFTFTRGQPKIYQSSAIVQRGFCEECGTPLYMREDSDENYEVAIGTLDNPNAVGQLSRQSGVESRVHWFTTLHQLPEETTDSYRSADELRQLTSLQHPDHDT